MLGEKFFNPREQIDPISGAADAVALVGIENLGYGAAVLLDRGHDLLGFGLGDARVLGALRDQKRDPDFICCEQR
jgi:hypothetical protein